MVFHLQRACSFETPSGLEGEKGKERKLAYLTFPWCCYPPDPAVRSSKSWHQVFHFLRWSKCAIADPHKAGTDNLGWTVELQGIHKSFEFACKLVWIHFSGKRVHYFNQISEGVLDPSKVTEPTMKCHIAESKQWWKPPWNQVLPTVLWPWPLSFKNIFSDLVSCLKWSSTVECSFVIEIFTQWGASEIPSRPLFVLISHEAAEMEAYCLGSHVSRYHICFF